MKALAVILVGVATAVPHAVGASSIRLPPRGPLPSRSPSLGHTQSIPWSDLYPSGMRRSRSIETVLQPKYDTKYDTKKQAAKGMEKSSSVPLNMHSMIDARRWQKLGVHDMQSHCVIKNSRCASSEMHVLMAAKNGQLRIYFEQLQAGKCKKFPLVDMRIDELVLMHSMRDENSFYIATPWKGRLDISIYCTPAALSVNSWLLTLQHMGARVRIFKEQSGDVLSTVCEHGECTEC